MASGDVLLSVDQIYGVDHGAIYYRGGGTVEPVEPIRSIASTEKGMKVRGVQVGDFAVFACLIDKNGSADVPFLVVQTSEDNSIMVPARMVENDVYNFGTPELAHKFQSVGLDEIAQFGLGGLYQVLAERYPLR